MAVFDLKVGDIVHNGSCVYEVISAINGRAIEVQYIGHMNNDIPVLRTCKGSKFTNDAGYYPETWKGRIQFKRPAKRKIL